jgi:hypothetical protein
MPRKPRENGQQRLGRADHLLVCTRLSRQSTQNHTELQYDPTMLQDTRVGIATAVVVRQGNRDDTWPWRTSLLYTRYSWVPSTSNASVGCQQHIQSNARTNHPQPRHTHEPNARKHIANQTSQRRSVRPQFITTRQGADCCHPIITHRRHTVAQNLGHYAAKPCTQPPTN